MLLVHREESLCREGRGDEKRGGPRRYLGVGQCQNCNYGRIDANCCRKERRDRAGKDVLFPRSRDVTMAKPSSMDSPVIEPASVARIMPPVPSGPHEATAIATPPVAAPTRNRLLVYVSHLSRGDLLADLRSRSSLSPSSDAAPTSPPASGPNKTAAKSIRTGEIDSSVVSVSRTLPRSAIAAAKARIRTIQMLPAGCPVMTRMTAVATAVAVKTPRQRCWPESGPKGRSCYVTRKGYTIHLPLVPESRSRSMRKAFVSSFSPPCLRALRTGSRQILSSTLLAGIPLSGDSSGAGESGSDELPSEEQRQAMSPRR